MNTNDEWYTPKHIITRVMNVMGNIDTDPFSNEIAQRLIQAKTHYTIDDSAFGHVWTGRVYMNPPYSASLIRKAIKFLTSYYEAGHISEFICLTNSGTDTKWNVPLHEYTQVYTNGRIQFLQPDGTTLAAGSRGQCFTYAGPHVHRFLREFCSDRFCWSPNIKRANYTTDQLTQLHVL